MEMDKTYKINKIFYTIQGEGPRFGIPQVFVRFSLCNLQCWFCDTEFDTFTEMTENEILAECRKVGGLCNNVSFCGGEPGIQLDKKLVEAFKQAGYYTSVESNGMYLLPDNLDYIVVSPKTKKVVQPYCDELRYVVEPKTNLDFIYVTKEKIKYKRLTISPMFDGEQPVEENIEHCKRLVFSYPHLFTLSLQQHKFIGVE